MRHLAKSHSFGRKSGPRKALIRGLVMSLVEHGRIKTTLAKAKELRRHVEKAITIGKEDSVETRRLLMSRFPDKGTVDSLVADLGKRFKTRPGGYTRIIKIGPRPGDRADMAFIEFVDYKLPEKTDETTVKADPEAKARSTNMRRRNAKHRKSVRKIQQASRAVSFRT